MGTPLYADYGHAGRSARQPHRNIATSHESVKGCTSMPPHAEKGQEGCFRANMGKPPLEGLMARPSESVALLARRELPHAPAYVRCFHHYPV